jgi:hypothetical protein
MMYKESDYEGGISFAARVAWMIAAWIALMLLMIVLSGPSNRVADPVPQKKIVNRALLCYRGEVENGRAAYICDLPVEPALGRPTD